MIVMERRKLSKVSIKIDVFLDVFDTISKALSQRMSFSF